MLPIVMAGNRLANCVCFIYIRLGIMFNSNPTVTTFSIVFRFTMLSSASGCVGCGFFNNGIGQRMSLLLALIRSKVLLCYRVFSAWVAKGRTHTLNANNTVKAKEIRFFIKLFLPSVFVFRARSPPILYISLVALSTIFCIK